jgi:hypothetical protein
MRFAAWVVTLGPHPELVEGCLSKESKGSKGAGAIACWTGPYPGGRSNAAAG